MLRVALPLCQPGCAEQPDLPASSIPTGVGWVFTEAMSPRKLDIRGPLLAQDSVSGYIVRSGVACSTGNWPSPSLSHFVTPRCHEMVYLCPCLHIRDAKATRSLGERLQLPAETAVARGLASILPKWASWDRKKVSGRCQKLVHRHAKWGFGISAATSCLFHPSQKTAHHPVTEKEVGGSCSSTNTLTLPH